MSDYNMRLTIGAICKYEAMTKSSFFSYADNPTFDRSLCLIYSTLVSHQENKMNTISFGEFVTAFKPKDIKKLSDALEKQIEVSNQFIPSFILDEEETPVNDEQNKDIIEVKNHIFISEMVPVLIADCNLDANYVYNDMDFNQIELFMQYKDKKEKAEMIEKRFWAYLLISPHINTKKCRTPEALLPFDWEKKEKQKKEMKKLDNMADKLRELGILSKETEKGEE